jgi:hypothetical protein
MRITFKFSLKLPRAQASLVAECICATSIITCLLVSAWYGHKSIDHLYK